MNYIEEIKSEIKRMEGKYSAYDIFSDWIHMLALAYSQAVNFKENREKEYCELSKKYSSEQNEKFGELGAMLVESYQFGKNEIRYNDILGEIYMTMDIGNKNTGQFFSPYSISEIMASIAKPLKQNRVIKLYEPTVGSGGNIIAVCQKLKEMGVNYQNSLKVIAQDLDYKAVYMSYVQFAILGIPAVVFQGDALDGKYNYDNAFMTPMLILNWNQINISNDFNESNMWNIKDNKEIKVGQQMNLLDFIN